MMNSWLINDEKELNRLPLHLFDRIVKPNVAYQRILSSFSYFDSLKTFVSSHQDQFDSNRHEEAAPSFQNSLKYYALQSKKEKYY